MDSTVPASPMVAVLSPLALATINAPASWQAGSNRDRSIAASSRSTLHLVEDIEPVHRHRDVQIPGRGQGDGRCLGVVENIEFGDCGDISGGRRAAHENQSFDPRRHLGMGAQQERDIGLWRRRDQGDRLVVTDRGQQFVPQQFDRRQW